MTEEEKNGVVQEVIKAIKEQSQNIAELPHSDNINEFRSLPVVTSDGRLKTMNIEQLKGDKGEDGRFRVVNHGTSDTTFELTPNTMHVWGEVESLNLTLAPNPDDELVAEYSFQFSTPTNKATTFSISGVKWINGVVPTIQAGKLYQGSIVSGVAVLISN